MHRSRPFHVRFALWLCLLAAAPLSAATPFVVGVVPSDDASLSEPAPRDSALTRDQVTAMVRRAVELAGGLAAVVPDTSRLVVIKPNDGAPDASGSGVVTDARVVRAVALVVHETAPEARILIAEGAGGWMAPSLVDCTQVRMDPRWVKDGFEIAGHRETVRELRAMGIDIACHDLNFDRAYKLSVPGGGLATDSYDIGAAILDADAWINVPVAKTHGAKITCCMKNHFGLLPGRLYGWSKNSGTDDHPPMPHAPRIVDEAWVDLWALTQVDFNVVDMIRGAEAGAFYGAPKRANLVLAGRDPVATDLVAARLMGFNPDDFEFADLAAQRGMGPGTIDHVQVRGGDVAQLASRWKKAGGAYGRSGAWGEWGEQADYGKGPRRWTLLGPLARDHAFTPTQIRVLDPQPGVDGWSPVVFFGHDKIDLDQRFDDPIDCAVYAFTRLRMATSDSVRFWLGSDEGLQVWLDGEPIYSYDGRRRHRLGGDRIPGYIAAGEHRLLVRAEQGRGGFDFSINVCEPIDDVLYAGNRYPGVRYFVTGEAEEAQVTVRAEDRFDGGIVGRHVNELAVEDPLTASRTAPDSLRVPVSTPSAPDLVSVLLESAGRGQALTDTLWRIGLGRMPFELTHYGLGIWWHPEYGPDPGRLLHWLGLRYALSEGYGPRESTRMIQGWLAQGHPVVSGFDTGWFLIDGIRATDAGTDIHITGADSVYWQPVESEWWAQLPGRVWAQCPLLVVEAAGEPLAPAALVDSIAAVAVEMGVHAPVANEDPPWGRREAFAGVAAWDRWVIDWERLPFTEAWASDPATQSMLYELREYWLVHLAAGRHTAAEVFAHAAQQVTAADRRQRLQRAAAGYDSTVAALVGMVEQLPTQRGFESEAEVMAAARGILATRNLPRRARDAERQALAALAQLTGAGPLPAVALDPLRRKERGRRLLTWQAEVSARGIYELDIPRQGEVRQRWITGREAEGIELETLAPFPASGAWQLAVEKLEGTGVYQVLREISAAAPGVVRIDDQWAARGNRTEIVVWAVPVE